MPLVFPIEPDPNAQSTICAGCYRKGNSCLADVRQRGGSRNTKFALGQSNLMNCAFEAFVPGTDNDSDPSRTYKFYREQAKDNAQRAGDIVWGPSEFVLTSQQRSKVDGDIYEMMEAAALWNAAAVWNNFMDTGKWLSTTFTQPVHAVPTPKRKIAIVKMARGSDTTKLLSPDARAEYHAFEKALKSLDMELKLSTPDILGLRIPDPMPASFSCFSKPLPDLTTANQELLETAWQNIQGTLEGRHFLFAIAVKTSVRSDRLYQALFEANVLKYILGYILRGPAIRFHAHIESFEGADVVGRYRAASMTSLLAGGTPTRAIDLTYNSLKPRDTAQMILDTLPTFPL